MMNSEESRSCALSYETFGECKHGDECEHRRSNQPYCTRKAFATIALDTPGELSGCVEFHPTEGDTSSKRKYYVPRGKWHNADANKGDTVAIQISEKRNKGGLRFARVMKVLFRPNIDMQLGLKICFTHITYGDCTHGANCPSHHLPYLAFKQNFYVAQVLSTSSSTHNGSVLHVSRLDENSETVERKYHLPADDDWHAMNVSEGNLVIVQESERTLGLNLLNQKAEVLHYGKVAAILHETQSLNEVSVPLEKHTRNGFILEPVGTGTLRCFANSVDQCPCNKTCHRIGIHIVATALGSQFKKLGPHFVPMERKNLKDPRISFDANMIRISISLYVHSVCNVVDGPVLTPLRIPSGEIFRFHDQYDANEHSNSNYLETMWPVFGAHSFLEDIAKGAAASYMVDFPATWRERYVAQQAKVFFSRYTMENLPSKHESFSIVRSILANVDIPEGEYAVPAEIVENLKAAWASPNDERELSLACVLSSAKRGVSTFWEDHFTGWYMKDVFNNYEIPENKVAMSTLPSYVTSDLVNQQVILSSMISPQMPLYLKSEVFGILVRRYETPTIHKAVVRRIFDTMLSLHVCGKYGRRYGNMILALRDLFPVLLDPSSSGSDAVVTSRHGESDKAGNSFVFLLTKFFSVKYCNSKVIRLSGDKLLALANSVVDVGVQAIETEHKVCELVEAECDTPGPYESHDKGTKVTLRCGNELQLQFRKEDEYNKGQTDSHIQLVKIGTNCHLCLLHLNSPIRAFGSDRSDISGLITEETLTGMKRQVHENCLKFEVLEDISIRWNDEYFSGGAFVTTRSMKAQNLLCIRKEINKSETNDPFVWTCHGVVSEVTERDVKFSVCSLHQDQTVDMWEDGDNQFIVEVIDIVADAVSTKQTTA